MGIIYKLYNYELVLNSQKRKDLLLNVTKKFHSSMDVSAILSDIIDALKQVFPSFDVYLLLSHEWEVSDELPIMQLSYGKDKSNEVATNAYLTGKIQIEDIILDRKSVLYAPLRGKQGVYGVLKIMASNSFVFPQHEIDFIEVLADTGGNAIENAELYQQSRQLVEDLQLINRTSHELNSNLRLSETISYMKNQIKMSFDAQEIGFFLFRPNGEFEVIEGSSNYFLKDSNLSEIVTICRRIKNNQDPLFIGDLSSEFPYLLKPLRSFIGVPMVQSGKIIGAVFIVHEYAYHFSFNQFKLLQSLIHHSTLAFTNSMLHEELETLVITDHLTRLYARNFLDEKVQVSMEKDAYGCFLLFDIDDFKQINDVYGHQVGDDIIIQVANILKQNIKNTDIAARWGGEELAVYLPKVDLEVGAIVAERIRKKVSRETSPPVTISCGISHWKQSNLDKSLKTLFNNADKALYSAKRTGKNVIVSFDKDTCYL
ncbi:diguanylate cyclase [Anaerobacillus alkaliphilus]|uniref:Diguanylate cyclase n=2 Tax=Anaerobacillus alkaliphilus TaxID=1548597 RepID=A0A4Q0VQG9_9BACI|nr:diguanylate cyclase [Anaerobacillus alkaliphilus]